MVHRYDMNTDLQGINGTTQPYGFIHHNNTKFVHIGYSEFHCSSHLCSEDVCLSSPCLNGAECQEYGDEIHPGITYNYGVCKCLSGWTGSICESGKVEKFSFSLQWHCAHTFSCTVH